MTAPHILIVGAGPGGLTLAQGLKKHNIPFTVFERDTTQSSRTQGYRIRMQPKGSAALRSTIPSTTFELFERTCGEFRLGFTKLNLATLEADTFLEGKEMFGSVNPAGQYTVDRAVLRAVLMTGIEEHIQFGKMFKSYTETEDGGIQADFTDGTSVTGTLLVAADGTGSRIRQQYLPHFEMVDTETRVIFGKTPLTSELRSLVEPKAIKYMSFFDQKSSPLKLFLEAVNFLEQPSEVLNGAIAHVSDYIYWVLIAPTVESHGMEDKEFLSISGNPLAEKSISLAKAAEWHEMIMPILEKQDPSSTSGIRILSSLPPLPEWEAKSNITLLGDAIHPMSPTGGIGLNTAVEDAADLCSAIVGSAVGNSGTGVLGVDAIKSYETLMRNRGNAAILGSLKGAQRMYGQKPYEECPKVQW